MLQKIGKKVMIFDGGFGTELEKYDLPKVNIPEELNIVSSDVIVKIHKEYEASGADFISTNTFGLNGLKIKKSNYNLEQLAIAAINNARQTKCNVIFDIGPLGQLLSPIGTLSFDEAYNYFKEVVLIASPLVDGFILETFTDLYELKAAILAVKENSDKMVIASMSFDETKRTLTGTTPQIMVNTLEGLGVDVLGVNCSLGPIELMSIVKEITQCSHIPVIVQANRGLPKIINGKTEYDLSVDVFKDACVNYVDMGVSIIGGCCGTNPQFIKAVSEFKDKSVKKNNNEYKTLINSASCLVDIENVKICGERLNPTGKKKLKEALINEDYDYLVKEAINQEENDADLLDLNVGLPKIDESNIMVNAIKKIQEVVSLPLEIDSSNYDAIEKGCRIYNGIPLINSVNGKDEIMDHIFPIAKKYGACIICLCLDENGVPKTALERLAIARKMVNKAKQYGIDKSKLIVDTLVLTASAEQDLVKETISALRMVREDLGCKTALGVSNVSFGLPNRPLLNRTFLTMAMSNGLNMPIMNPMDREMVNAIKAYNVLVGIDKNSEQYISLNVDSEAIKNTSNDYQLYDIVLKGLKNQVVEKTLFELENKDPMDIINNILIKALKEVGEKFDSGKLFLPQLIMSAETTKLAFELISNKFPKSDSKKGPIILATVKNDVHDIGKNIVKVILESYGYKVIDLGKDVDKKEIVDAFYKYSPKAIGLSALMTTTVISMEDTITELKKIKGMCKIFVGGAVLTEDIAQKINADYYTKDALELVKLLDIIL